MSVNTNVVVCALDAAPGRGRSEDVQLFACPAFERRQVAPYRDPVRGAGLFDRSGPVAECESYGSEGESGPGHERLCTHRRVAHEGFLERTGGFGQAVLEQQAAAGVVRTPTQAEDRRHAQDHVPINDSGHDRPQPLPSPRMARQKGRLRQETGECHAVPAPPARPSFEVVSERKIDGMDRRIGIGSVGRGNGPEDVEQGRVQRRVICNVQLGDHRADHRALVTLTEEHDEPGVVGRLRAALRAPPLGLGRQRRRRLARLVEPAPEQAEEDLDRLPES